MRQQISRIAVTGINLQIRPKKQTNKKPGAFNVRSTLQASPHQGSPGGDLSQTKMNYQNQSILPPSICPRGLRVCPVGTLDSSTLLPPDSWHTVVPGPREAPSPPLGPPGPSWQTD